MKSLFIAQAADADAVAATGAVIEGSKNAVSSSYGSSLDFLRSTGDWPVVNTIARVLGPFAPYIGALIVFLLAWLVICPFIRWSITKALSKTTWDDKLAKWAGNNPRNSERGVGQFFYYLSLLFFVVLALDIAGLKSVTEPLQALLDQFLQFIPGLVGAALILTIAVFVGKIVKNLLASFLNGVRLDQRLGSKPGTTPVSTAIVNAVFWLFILLILPAALQSVQLGTVAQPILNIVNLITAAIPNILLASLILAVGFLIAQIARKLVTNLLIAVGVDSWPSKIGLAVPVEGSRSVSSIVGYTVMISLIVLFASTAINTLNIELLEDASRGFVEGYFRILLAVLIFGAGLLLSRFAYENLADKNRLLAKIVRVSILVLTGVAALHRSQIIPQDLVELPYDAIIAAAAVALGVGGAIAIGLGGKDQVSRFLGELLSRRNRLD